MPGYSIQFESIATLRKFLNPFVPALAPNNFPVAAPGISTDDRNHGLPKAHQRPAFGGVHKKLGANCAGLVGL
jgi:hypothetical protein